jgi:hypothetical protein
MANARIYKVVVTIALHIWDFGIMYSNNGWQKYANFAKIIFCGMQNKKQRSWEYLLKLSLGWP